MLVLRHFLSEQDYTLALLVYGPELGGNTKERYESGQCSYQRWMMLRKWDGVRKRRAFARRPVSMTAKICTSDGNPEPWRMANPWGNGLANSPQFTAGIAFGKEVTVNAKGRGRSVGLGKPNRGAIVTAECTYSLGVVDSSGTTGLQCEDTLLMGSFEVNRTKGEPSQANHYTSEGVREVRVSP